MNLYEVVRVALLDLALHKFRSALATIGIIFGVASVMAMISISEGAKRETLGRIARLGVDNVYATHAERYPRVPIEELRSAEAECVVLPDEPYRFTAEDGAEAFEGRPCALVSGRHLTWYGPSLVEAPRCLRRLGGLGA